MLPTKSKSSERTISDKKMLIKYIPNVNLRKFDEPVTIFDPWMTT